MTIATRPNVVLIYMDDQAFRTIASLNNPEIHTPHLDELVRRGTKFTHAFNQGAWSEAVCVASRAMLITGMNLFHAHDQVDTAPLLGQHLAANGYDTFFTGKWHNSAETLVRSYTEIGPWYGGLNAEGYSPDNCAYSRPAPGNDWRPDDMSQGRHWMDVDGRILHSSERWTDAAVDFLDRSVDRSKPFLLHLAYHAPHDPRQTHPEFLDRYPLKEIEIPPNFQPEHPFDQGDARSRDEYLAPFPRTEDAVRVHRREYYAILTHVDQQIGRVTAALDHHGLSDDTIFVFSSDHGLAVGEHGLMGKQNQYDHSVRVPLIIAGPHVPEHRTIDALVYQNSIFPTICDMIGLQPPDSVETPSLLPLMNGEVNDIHRSIFGAYRNYQRMVRTRSHKLIAYPHLQRIQLFDLEHDPWETTDLGRHVGQRALISDLRQEMTSWQEALSDDLDLSAIFDADSTD